SRRLSASSRRGGRGRRRSSRGGQSLPRRPARARRWCSLRDRDEASTYNGCRRCHRRQECGAQLPSVDCQSPRCSDQCRTGTLASSEAARSAFARDWYCTAEQNREPPIIRGHRRNGGSPGYESFCNLLSGNGFGIPPRSEYGYDSRRGRAWPDGQVLHGHLDRGSRRRHYQSRPAGALRYDRGRRHRVALQQDRHGTTKDHRRSFRRELPRLLRHSRSLGRRQDRQKQGRQLGHPVPRQQRRQGPQDRRNGRAHPDPSNRSRCNGGVGIVNSMSSLEARRLVLRNDVAELQRLAGWLERLAQQGMSSDVSFAVQLCLEEAVANIIMYGAARGDRLEIAVELERNGGTLVARIEDNGRQFDPTRAPPPAVATSLEQAKVGDLGIHLMRSFASGMDYERRDGRNRLTLRFVESRPSPPE